MEKHGSRVLALLIALSLGLSCPLSVLAANDESLFEDSQDEEIQILSEDSAEEFADEVLVDTEDESIDDTLDITEQDVDFVDDALKVTGSDSLGRMLSSSISEKVEEQESNNGNNIFSIEIDGKKATVEYEVTQEAELVVGIYEEDGVRLLATGKTTVLPEGEIAEVEIDIDTMPQYFYVKANLILSDTLEPLCCQFESPDYTQEMQEFFASTVADYDEDLVLNLDSSSANNFLVFNEDVVRAYESDTQDILTYADEDNLEYKFDNISSSIRALRAGDVLSYEKTDGSMIIISIGAITISDDGCAIISGSNSQVEDVFDYVKINSESAYEDTAVDASDLEDGITYLGDLSDEEFADLVGDDSVDTGSFLGKRVGVSSEAGWKLKPTFGFKKGKVEGCVGLEFKGTLKYNITLSYQSITTHLDYQAFVSLKASAKTPPINFYCANFVINPLPTIVMEFKPAIILQTEGKIEAKGSISGRIGYSYNSKTKWHNDCKSPKPDSSLKADVSLFLGLSMEVKVSVLHSSVANSTVSFSAGVRITAQKEKKVENGNIHICNNCFGGDIKAVYECKCSIQFLNLHKLKYSLSFEATIKLSDWHWSFDYNEFALNKCSHKAYPIEFTVKDTKGQPIHAAEIKTSTPFIVNDDFGIRNENSIYTTKAGKIKGYLPKGSYNIVVSSDKHNEKTVSLKVKEKPGTKKITLTAKGSSDDGGDDDGDDDDDDDDDTPKAIAKVSKLSTSDKNSAIITPEGDLYLTGSNTHGELGIGENSKTTQSLFFRKAMSDVADVDLGEYCGIALKKDGTTWTWGYNNYGQIGNGTRSNALAPVKVIDGVRQISAAGSTCCAVKTDNSLWLWGAEYSRRDEPYEGHPVRYYYQILNPKKIMDDVLCVCTHSDVNAVIKNDGSLWMWGCNEYGQLGNGNTDDSLTPIKVLENVKKVDISGSHVAAIKNDGSLWMWGVNSKGQFGNGSTTDSMTPLKILDSVKDVFVGGSSSSGQTAIIKEDDTLWVSGQTNLYLNSKYYADTNVFVKVLSDVSDADLNKEGGSHDGAIKKDGSLWRWGNNYFGVYGNGNNKDSYTPICVSYSDDENAEMIPLTSCYAVDKVQNGILSSDVLSCKDKWVISEDNLTYYSTEILESHFYGLVPYTNYNFYVLSDEDYYDPLDSSNILYITQGQTDGNGDLDIKYIPREDDSDATAFVVKQWEYRENEIDEDDIDEDTDIPQGLWMAGLNALTYDGTNQVQNVRIYDGQTLLTEKKDYTLSYKNNKNSFGYLPDDDDEAKKAPQIIITMKGNYTGKQTVYFVIDPLCIEDPAAFNVTFKTSGKKTLPVLCYNGKKLKEKSDYTVRYEGSKYVLEGIGNYSGTIKASPSDPQAATLVSMSKIKVAAIPDLIYKGSAYTETDISEAIKNSVTYNKSTLVINEDYIVSKVINSRNVGTATVVLKGLKDSTRGNAFFGEKRIKVKIAPYPISGENVSVLSADGDLQIAAAYTKGGAKPEIILRYNGRTLKNGRDYALTYSNNKAIAESAEGKNAPTISITGKGNYGGKTAVNFTISQAKFAAQSGIRVLATDLVISKDTSKYATKISVYDKDGSLLKAGTDYNKEIVYKKGDIVLDKTSTVSIGDEITVEVTGSGKNYTNDTITATYRILPEDKDISKATIKIKDQAYTGAEVRITSTSQIASAYIGKDKTPIKISVDGGKTGDFIVVDGSYVKNISKGTARVTLKGINNYGGYKTVTFKIGARSIKDWWKELLAN